MHFISRNLIDLNRYRHHIRHHLLFFTRFRPAYLLLRKKNSTFEPPTQHLLINNRIGIVWTSHNLLATNILSYSAQQKESKSDSKYPHSFFLSEHSYLIIQFKKTLEHQIKNINKSQIAVVFNLRWTGLRGIILAGSEGKQSEAMFLGSINLSFIKGLLLTCFWNFDIILLPSSFSAWVLPIIALIRCFRL